MRNTCAKKRAMIPLKLIPWQSDAWTRALADAITDPRALLAATRTRSPTTSTSRRIFRCACRIRSSIACASAIPTIRCCDRYCRCRPSATPSSVTRWIRSRRRGNASAGRHSEVSRPRPVDRGAGVRGALPLLFPSHISVRRPPTSGGVSVADRGRARSEHLRSDSVRRRSADAEGRTAAPTHRAARRIAHCVAFASTRVCRW